MSIEKRIQYLLEAARRADQEGAERTARSLRRMAEEARESEARRQDRGPAPVMGLVSAAVGCMAE
jgi:hypothetical protein